MAKPATRIRFMQVMFGLGTVAILARAFQLQILQHSAWRARAESRDVRTRDVPARRGALLDRDGVPLAVTAIAYHITLAHDQVEDATAVARLLTEDLHLPAATVRRVMQQPVPYFDGPFSSAEVQRVRRLPGVDVHRITLREYPMGAVGRRLLGRTARTTDTGTEGFEAAFDSLLRGVPGRERFLRDGNGRALTIPGGMVLEPRPGHDIVLTIDHELQAIAEEVLRVATARERAQGGDIVVLDVTNGEVLAVASLRTLTPGGGPVPTSSALVESAEPGSTAKIFTAAAVLTARTDTTPQYGENGVWVLDIGGGGTRTIRDTHRESGFLTLGRTIAVSSNIAISKFALKLQTATQYRMLRDFGFGTGTASGFPGEDDGYLVPPAGLVNEIDSRASWAQGYQWRATSLQIAAGYAAIANGGHYIAPTFLRAVRGNGRDPDGTLHRPDTLRQVLTEEVDQRLLGYLQMATDSGGTGVKAQLDQIDVIGKTGTAKLTNADHNYVGEYRASFAGIFPADRPRFVVYVMIDRPDAGEIYGGAVAAPLVRSLVQQALALDDSPLGAGGPAAASLAVAELPVPATAVEAPTRRVPFPRDTTAVATPPAIAIPDVRGWSVRDGVFALHRRGLLVRLYGTGAIDRLDPAPGDSVVAGTIISVHAGEDR
ncbi:MAG TPA: penicillin-binding transpeptidase domain-containing protein [Gemmatimonadales bacterium]|nr:penicillin-binding transpeptidase domain-containing protein [Gemmatimonadales bacterium]